jgi:hypothetical protein
VTLDASRCPGRRKRAKER